MEASCPPRGPRARRDRHQSLRRRPATAVAPVMPRGGALRSVLRFKRIERNPDRRRLAPVASVDDLRRIARRRLPRGVFGYVDGGAEDELTLARNVAGFA